MYIYVEDVGIPIFMVGVVVLIIILPILQRKKENIYYLFFFTLFWVYAMCGVDKVFFPIEISGDFVNSMRSRDILSTINLVPFDFGQYGLSFQVIKSFVYNIILTIPFGFGINFLHAMRLGGIFKISVLVGVGIELTQLAISFALGYPYRIVDINDVIANALGVWLGYALFCAFGWLFMLLTRKLNIDHKGLSLYIHKVVTQHRTDTE